MKKILLLCLISLACQQDRIIIDNTSSYIAFHRIPDIEPIWDYNIWLINSKTGEEIQITDDLEYWERSPVWLSDSELVYLHLKPTSKTRIVHFSFINGKRECLASWTYKTDPGLDKISIYLFNKVYYSGTRRNAVYVLSLKEKQPMPNEVLSPADIKELGLGRVFNPVVSPDGTKLLIVACDTAMYRYYNEKGMFCNDDIYLYDLKKETMKGALERLTYGDTTHDYSYPVWVDNDSIIFSSNKEGDYELYLMNIIEKKTRRLTFTKDVDEIQATVSPDTKMIAYSIDIKNQINGEIWLMDLETLRTWYLTKGSSPDWSPAQ